MNGGHKPPDGQMRRSQLLFTGGPGALVDLVEHAVIVGGLEHWRYAGESGFFEEPRLSDWARTLVRDRPGWPDQPLRLRLPPECDSREPDVRVGLQVLRFPGWFLCQNEKCRSIVRAKLLEKDRHRCSEDRKGGLSPVVPLRFVASCLNGHLQDIDWDWFVHRERTGAQNGRFRAWCERKAGANDASDPLGEEWRHPLKMKQVGTTGELADYVVHCRSCGKQRGLQDLAQKGVLGPCQGHRPWIGPDQSESCDQTLKLLTRTASNAYFSTNVSVLRIPDPADELRADVERVWDVIEDATPETWPVLGKVPKVRRALARWSDPDVLAEIGRRQQGLAIERKPVRELEWEHFLAAGEETPGELPKPDELLFARRLKVPDLPPFLERVVLVKHLTEVRAQLGFTRIEPLVGDEEAGFRLTERVAPLARDLSWIPAIPILGEGIFLALDGAAIDRWLDQGPESALRIRERAFKRGLERVNETRTTPIPFPGLHFVMLHTLSHLLITSISLECGYAASSIRERLYSKQELVDGRVVTRRAGILLTTGSPGSEGTLGGLVEVGRDIGRHLRMAVERALLCSNDPVCAGHSPDDPQEGRHREGAACHGCVFIGEPSCERMNQELDRALLVPTVDAKPGVAFLEDWVASWDP